MTKLENIFVDWEVALWCYYAVEAQQNAKFMIIGKYYLDYIQLLMYRKVSKTVHFQDICYRIKRGVFGEG
jgi:hypothetical protein